MLCLFRMPMNFRRAELDSVMNAVNRLIVT
jgi:hypothetical protein